MLLKHLLLSSCWFFQRTRWNVFVLKTCFNKKKKISHPSDLLKKFAPKISQNLETHCLYFKASPVIEAIKRGKKIIYFIPQLQEVIRFT